MDSAALGARLLSGTAPAFVELLETLGEAVTIRDENDALVYANRAALRHLGFDSLSELQEHGLHAVMDEYVVRDEHGRLLSMADIPSVRLLHGQTPEPLLLHTVHRVSGETRWEQLKAAAVGQSGERPRIAITVIEDLTALKTAEVHMRILSDSGQIFASSLDPERTLAQLAEVAVPALADWCLVDLLDARGQREHVASAHRDPDQCELVAGLRRWAADPTDPSSTLGRVISTGIAELFTQVTDEYLVSLDLHPDHLKLVRALDMRSAMVVPMRLRSRTVGVMTFGTSVPGARLTEEDLAVAQQLAGRAALAVESSNLHATLRGVAERLAHSLLPAELPEVPGWEIEALYRPGSAGQGIEIGGDFYEVFRTEQTTMAVIGDVTGRGVTAATTTPLLRHGARFAGRVEPHPAQILRRLDEELRHGSSTMLCSALCARIERRELVLSSAGHPPALLRAADGTVSEITTAGPLLGAFPDAHWAQESIQVRPGELVLVYTDGVTETRGSHSRFGLERLKSLLSEVGDRSPVAVLAALEQELERYREGIATDDVAALALRPVP